MLKDGQSKLELLSGIQVGSSLKSMHTFGCPVFALQNALAAGHSIPQWNPRACIGPNLGPSPTHARNVHLVLSLTTGLVSLQFHCCFDDFFKACKYGVSNASTQSTWQYLAGFKHTTINPLYSRMKDCLGRRYLTKMELHKGHSFLWVTFPSQVPRHATETCSLRMVKLNFHLTPWNNHLKTPNYHLEKPGARESKLPSLPDSRLTKREGYELRKCLRKLRTKPESALEVG